ncbi:PP2C family protein-serine/threonine phosphatase [Marinoscillum sp. MHG1-6]|uniref:PP2C family protein-serine/threonine phosphatase n=1 Tax=Marinoscillum sp. MHG1-6 TaxID=2959627 RepID=UPI00215791E4|nr:PP2C family protein-serine/threonine phosphatase [Marinoscillum sp. MHG1-6]
MSGTLDIKDLELNALLEVTQAINNNLSEKDLYKIYKFTLLGDLKVRRMALFVGDAGWKCMVHFGTQKNWDGQELDPYFLSLKKTTHLDDKVAEFDKAIPVFHKDRLLAVVLMGGEEIVEGGGSSTFLQALTNIIIVAIENKRLAKQQLEQEAYRRELEIAKKVQNFLFPKSLPKSKKLSIEAVYLPHHDVGGDYYDYLAIDNDRFLVCVADVSGKGVPAALLMSNFQASLRTLVRKTLDPKEIVEELNHVIYNSGNAENFITFFLGIYDFKACTFEYINCGHNPQYLLSGGELTELNEGTTILGMFDPLPFVETRKIEGLKNFFFFGYTDGLTETFNKTGEQFGEDRVKNALQTIEEKDLQAFHKDLFKKLDEFREDVSYSDDITMLSCSVSN